MNRDEIKGKFDKAKGAVKEGFGAATGDRSTEIKGKAERLKGNLQEKWGEAKSDLDSEIDRDLKDNPKTTGRV
ncbi:MAG: CsbD family protein [Acidobacteriota bacterium]